MANLTGSFSALMNDGKMTEVQVTIEESTLKEIHNFVQAYHESVEAFDYSFNHALEYIWKRGKAEIERSQKSKEKLAEKNDGVKELLATVGAKNMQDLRAKVKALAELAELAEATK